MEYAISLVATFIEGVSAVLLHSAWLTWKEQKVRLLIATAVFAIVPFCFIHLYNGDIISKAVLLICQYIAIGLLFWNGNFLFRLMIAIVYYAVANSLDCFAAAMLWLVADADYQEFILRPLPFLAGIGISKGLLLILSVYLHHMAQHIQGYWHNWKDWFLLVLPSIGLLGFSFIFITYIREYDSVDRQLGITLTLFAAITILYVTRKPETGSTQQDVELLKKQHQELIQQNREQRALLHDTTNFSITFGRLLENDQKEEALALIKQLMDRCEKLPSLIDTDNPTVDAVLNDRCAEAAKSGIQLRVEICSLKDLAMQELDIVTLFANLLDNARNACMACTDTRRISIQAVPVGDGDVRLTVRNTYVPHPQQHIFQPSSARVSMHGYGQQNIRHVLEKYGCPYDFDQEDGWYRAITFLPCPPSSTDK